MDWVSHPFRYMSSKLNKFLVDFGENNASSIINFIPFELCQFLQSDL